MGNAAVNARRRPGGSSGLPVGPERERPGVEAAHLALLQRHALHAPQQAHPNALVSLQRAGGNAATTLAIQRATKLKGKIANPFDVGSGASEQQGGVFGTVSQGLDPNNFRSVPDNSLNPGTDSIGTGFTGGSLGGLQGVTGIIGSSIATDASRKARKEYQKKGIKAGVTLENRNLRMTGTDIAKNVVTTGSAVTDLTSKGLAITAAGTSTAMQASVAAGAWAAPLALFNALRDGRKGVKAWMRCARLQSRLDSWNEPRQKLNELKERHEALEEARSEAETAHATAETRRATEQQKADTAFGEQQALENQLATLAAPQQRKGIGKVLVPFDKMKQGIDTTALKAKIWAKKNEVARHRANETEAEADKVTYEGQVRAAIAGKTALEPEVNNWLKKQEEMVQIVGNTGKAAVDEEFERSRGTGSGVQAHSTAKGPNPPTLLEINAYAFSKNYSGTIKKLLSSVGGLFATAGGAAMLAVSIAALAGGGALAMATPVGWALAGVAAVIGLGLAGFKAIKWLKKRWAMAATDKAGTARTTGARLGTTLAFWKPAGKSRRELYGKKLLEYALGDKCYEEQMLEARGMIKDLGISWTSLEIDDLALAAPKLPPVPSQTANTGGSVGLGASTGIDGGSVQAHDFDFQARGSSQKGGASQTLPLDTWKAEKVKQAAGQAYDQTMLKKLMKFKAAKELVTAKLAS
jgi:hypothetical protein